MCELCHWATSRRDAMGREAFRRKCFEVARPVLELLMGPGDADLAVLAHIALNDEDRRFCQHAIKIMQLEIPRMISNFETLERCAQVGLPVHPTVSTIRELNEIVTEAIKRADQLTAHPAPADHFFTTLN